ncbi:MAG TPA: type 1 glutamine amidotransferase [Polyangia bacterium]
MRALAVEHQEHEGAGLVGAALADGGVRVDVVRTWLGDALPTADGAGYDLVVVFGGPMSANDRALDGEAALLAASARAGRPTVGICLGAQLLARGLGATVRRGPAPEIGLFPLSLTGAGRRDPLVGGLDGATMFQWHYDTFELPPGAVLLASTARYAHQAFRVGARAWGVQFHPECSRAMRLDWAARGADEVRAAGCDPAALAGDDALDARGRAFSRALLQLVGVHE